MVELVFSSKYASVSVCKCLFINEIMIYFLGKTATVFLGKT